jgi:hypothetical protein
MGPKGLTSDLSALRVRLGTERGFRALIQASYLFGGITIEWCVLQQLPLEEWLLSLGVVES